MLLSIVVTLHIRSRIITVEGPRGTRFPSDDIAKYESSVDGKLPSRLAKLPLHSSSDALFSTG
jgi:hypothetical protein